MATRTRITFGGYVMTMQTKRAAAALRRHLNVLKLGTGAMALAVASAWVVPAVAQETTSSIRGQIFTAEGEPAAGVNVEIIHTPSGTRSSAAVNSQGTFLATGLRIGGPYTIRFSGSGIQTQQVENVFITLGEPFSLDLVLQSGQQQSVEEIVVTGQRTTALVIGSGTQFDRRTIENTPSATRDLKDVIKRDPKVSLDPTNGNAITIAGANNRFNSLTVDGVKQNDDFGLNANGYPTQRVPISLDAIDQLSVLTAPYDVEYSGFTGGTVNIVTKSGTNEFTGSLFYYYSDDNLSGDRSKNNKNIISPYKDKTYGGSIGGPLIEDKLFFFVNYEKYSGDSSISYGPEGSGAGQTVRGITQAEYEQVAEIARRVYGYDAMGLGEPQPESDEKILAKVDWNLTDDHRISAAYQRDEGNNYVTSSNNTRLGYDSYSYDRSQKMESYSLQVFSDWTTDFSTEAKVGYKKVDSLRPTTSPLNFSSIIIRDPGGSQFVLGTEPSSQSNVLETETLSYKLKGTYLLGDHKVEAGWERDDYDYYNLFVQRSLGEFEFNTIADFEARRASRFRYNSAAGTNNPLDAAADWGYKVDSLFVQDEWNITPDFTLTAGLRYEYYSSDDKPRLNTNFVSRYGFGNDENLDGRDLWLPRAGFNWKVQDGTTLRGGVGLFSALGPTVWMSNNYSNDGITQVGIDIRRANTTPANSILNNVDPNSSAVVPAAGQLLASGSDSFVNALDPDFKIPSTWRASFAVDQVFDLGPLGSDYIVTAEAIYSRVKEAVSYRDLRLIKVGTAPDGRPIYQSRADGRPSIGTNSDLLVTNTDEGDGVVLTLGLAKTWETDYGDFDLGAGYAYQNIDEVHALTSSVASSNYENLAVSDPNDPGAGTSDYEVKHRFTTSVSWSKAFFGDYETTLSLFHESREGRPYSYAFRCGSSGGNANPFGDPACTNNNRSRQLFYVPSGANDPLVTYAPGFSYDQLLPYLQENGLTKYAGRIAPRNGFTSPWVHTFDLHIAQEIPGLLEGHRGVFTFDIRNLGNMLNKDWGRLEQVSFSAGRTVDVLEARIVDGKYVYAPGSAGLKDPNSQVSARSSVWSVLVGVRYEF